VKRLAELQARRQALLARCETQREELSTRLMQLSPRRWAHAAAGGVDGLGRAHSRHPLAWVIAIAGLLLLKRPRTVLSLLVRARTALTLVSRATQVLSLFGALRRRR
jgi:hypothetical protein